MNKSILLLILFFSFTTINYGQENDANINRLAQVTNIDSVISRKMNKITSTIIRKAQLQIRGTDSKEKLEAYTAFIKKESTELLKKISSQEITKEFNNNYTPEEINELNAFFETPTGKKFFEKNRNIKKGLKNSFQSNYLPDFYKKIEKELARLDGKIWREAYKVKPEEVIVYNGDFTHHSKLVRIIVDKKKQETLITLAVPIFENKFWVRYDKKTEIVDVDSKMRYSIKRLDKGLILHKTMIVSDQKYKMIEVTMVFPLLNESVEVIDIVQKISDDADLMSNNSAGFGENPLANIRVKKYF